jgi:hypothetical protein
MSEREAYAISGTIVIDGVHFPVSGPVGYSNLGRFAQKATVGDYSRDSDDLQSAWILSDFTGGFGRYNLRAGLDEGRFWTGTLWAREPFALTLPRRTVVHEGLNRDSAVPLGVLGDRMFALFGRSIQRWDETSESFETPAVATLAADLVSPYVADFQGTAAQPSIILPMGNSGYQAFDGATLTAQYTDIHPVAFCKWDQRLWALSLNGELAHTDGVHGTTPTWTTVATLDGSEEPVQLFTYLDRAEQWTLYVVSRRAIWAWDPVSTRLVLTQFRDVYHPDMGRGVTIWRPGEDVFISAGLQVWDWNLASASPMGPGREDGVPWDLRGRILGLTPDINSMWALIEGKSTLTTEEEALTADTPFDDTLYAPSRQAVCSVFEWTGFGWHIAWRADSAEPAGTLASIAVLQAEGEVRAWWGCHGMLYTQLIPREMTTMRQLIESGAGDFAERGFLDTGWFDAGMRGFSKLGSHVELNLDAAGPEDYFEVLVAYDGESTFQSLGRADHRGRTVFPFNVDGTGFSLGTQWNRIRFVIRAFGSAVTSSPLADSLVLKFLKLPLSSGAWRTTIPLDYQWWGGRTSQTIKEELDTLLAKEGFVKLQFGEDAPVRRCRITSLDGIDDTGWSDLGRRDIAIAEISLPPLSPNGMVP